MPYIRQINGIKDVNKEVSFLQDRLKKNEKSLNQFQNGLKQVGRLWLKQGQKIISGTKKLQEILKSIFESKIKQFKNRIIY